MQRTLSEYEIRAARLAVFRYGASQDDIVQAMQSVLKAQTAGEEIDLLEVLKDRKVLSSKQVHDLRFGLNQTMIDVNAPPAAKVPNGRALNNAVNHTLHALLDQNVHQLGDYRLLRQLGEGGMGVVYLAFDKHRNRQVAIKVLSPEFAAQVGLLDRFLREGESGLALNHPHIVRNYSAEIDSATGLHYLVLEYIEGLSAQDLLERDDKLQVGDAVCVVLQVANALEYAHRIGIVHRDIKPGNILLTKAGVAKLSDMGLAKRKNDPNPLTLHRQGIGTPFYMPYEQAMNAKTADERSDIYALGATLYHLLTGEVPFPGDSPMEIVEKKKIGFCPPARFLNPDVPLGLDTILAKMLASDPKDRYQTISEVIVELERSKLAVQVPSFVDVDQALKDPEMQQRLAGEVQPTAPDLRLEAAPLPKSKGAPLLWYVRYSDRQGKACKTKMTLAQVQQRLRDGKLPHTAEAADSPEGPFEPVASFAEFRPALRAAGPREAKPTLRQPESDSTPGMASTDRKKIMIAVASGLAVLILVLLGLVFWWS